MKITTRASHGVLIAALALAPFTSSCGKEEAGDPPALPPAESMQMDLDVFTQSGTRALPGMNYGAAALRVGLLNLGLVLALAPPTVVFAAALQAKPQYKDGKWVWAFDTQSGVNQYGVELSGKTTGEGSANQLELALKVTCSTCVPALNDFVWYTGTFSMTSTTGSWQFFDARITTADKSFVRLDYEVTDAAHRKLTFTNNRVDGKPDAGDVIEYLRDGDTARVSVQDKDVANYVAQISIASGAGYIEVPGYNGGNRACWDSSHQNATCP